MSGEAKRKYNAELVNFNKKLKRPIYLISEVLPKNYTNEDVLKYFKKFYPFEWKIICQRYETYKAKDEFLVKQGKKRRYKHLPPKKYFYSLDIVKNLLSDKHKKYYNDNFIQEVRNKKLEELERKRFSKIKRRKDKIEKVKENLQSVEPYFLDVYIAAYHRRGNTIDDKIEILKEIEKYDCKKSNDFFSKLNDSEKNLQIRQMAFDYLNKKGEYVKLRKKTKVKNKLYMTEVSDFYMTPKDLLIRINEDTIQNKKQYDVFISHSSKDSNLVKRIIAALNKHKLNCYCDWTSDNDFLRRELAGDFTKEVLKKRMSQSKYFLLINTKNSLESEWVKFERNYYSYINSKSMFYIDMGGGNIDKLQKLIYIYDNNEIIW